MPETPQLPEAFVRQTESLLGEEEAARLLRAIATEPPVSIRLNPLKRMPDPAGAEKVGWATEGFYLPGRPAFTFDPLLHAGCYYVQEASSMFVEQAFRQTEAAPRRVLDLCAAPGGKSTLWRSLLPEGCLLVCNEPLRPRAEVLAENMAKWGHPDTVVTNAYPGEFARLGGFFDIVAADVPCSGEGMFRKDDGAVGEWSTENVAACAERQMQIVRDVWPALREGGFLVYSTCTFNRAENEENVERICHELGAEPVEINRQPAWGIAGDTAGKGLPVCHFFPHLAKGEGFFLALLRKTAEAPEAKGKKQKRDGKRKAPAASATLARWLRRPELFRLFQADETHVAAVRETLFADMQRLGEAVRVVSAGILLAEAKGKKTIPQQLLALSTELATEAFPLVELSYGQAIAYLRKESICLPGGTPTGFVVATFRGHALGFLNNLGTRANNLYPAEWRIRSSHVPKEPTDLFSNKDHSNDTP